MSSSWAKSVSYREALDGLTARFSTLKSLDRIATTELNPTIDSINGYLFAINSAPAKISPTQWLGDLLPLIQLPDEPPADAVNLLISYQIHCKNRLEQQKYSIPDETDALKAIAAGSALNSFSQGFELGYRLVESIWSATTPEELRKELESQIFALKFFASTEYANKFIATKKSKLRPDQLADQVIKNIYKAADLHVRLGISIEAGLGSIH